MAVNKVVLASGETLIDLTATTVTADKLAVGYTALDKTGALINGAMTPGEGGGGGGAYNAESILLDDGTQKIKIVNAEGGGASIDGLKIFHSRVTIASEHVDLSLENSGIRYIAAVYVVWSPLVDGDYNDRLSELYSYTLHRCVIFRPPYFVTEPYKNNPNHGLSIGVGTNSKSTLSSTRYSAESNVFAGSLSAAAPLSARCGFSAGDPEVVPHVYLQGRLSTDTYTSPYKFCVGASYDVYVIGE